MLPITELQLHEFAPGSIEPKTAHLILLALLLNEHGVTAVEQGIAARRAGATWDELRDVVRLVFLRHSQPAANRGDEFLTSLTKREHEDKVAGAFAAYG